MFSKNSHLILFSGVLMFSVYLLLVYVFDFGDSFSVAWSILFFLNGLMMGSITVFMDSRKRQKNQKKLPPNY